MEIRNEELERLYEESFHGIEVGSILTGRVLSVKPEGVIVDVGYKSEGLIKSVEFSGDELDGLNPGEEIEVFVDSLRGFEGMVVLSKDKADRIKAWASVESSFNENESIEGIITEKTKGGTFVDISGIKAFMPASHIDLRPVKNVDSLIGQQVKVKIIKVNSRRSNVIVSRRLCLEEERKRKKEDTLKKLHEGALLKGTVKNITDYGVFVDLGGLDGLLHISDISWGRITHPSKHFQTGQEIEVIVLGFDKESEKITLGYKQKMEDPWLTVAEKYPEGTRLQGKVVSVMDYGAFVEVEDALEGLVHASEIEWSTRPKHPSKYLSSGDMVEAVVLKADKDDRRLSLSLKQIKPSPWQLVAERYMHGQVISGSVRGITEFGVFVGLPEGVDGLVHISDLSWTKHIRHPSEILKKGQEIEAVVLSIEADKERMALGIKQLTSDPWSSEIPDKFMLGDEIKCKLLRKTEYGWFVELEGEVEGLIYTSELLEDADNPYEEGIEIDARIIKVDLENKKIGLSMKNVKGGQGEE
jgi:small subunit ribosomal protein S1